MRSMRRATGEIAERRRFTTDEVSWVDQRRTSFRSVPSRSQAISMAMSWLVKCLIDGFAAYAEAMHPCVLDLDGNPDLPPRMPDADARQKAPIDRLVPWPLASRPWQNEDEAQLRRKPAGPANGGPTVSPEMLDDRMLHDFGLPRGEDERLAWHMDPWEW